VNEAAGWHQQQHAKTESAVAPEASAQQASETGTVLDLKAPAEDRVGPFAFNAAAPVAYAARTAQHPGAPKSNKSGDLEISGVPPRKLARKPFGVGIFAQGPRVVRESILGRRLVINQCFEKRVALVRRPIPSLRACSDHGSNSRLEIEPMPDPPFRGQSLDLNFVQA
jgi:hypothetical protein